MLFDNADEHEIIIFATYSVCGVALIANLVSLYLIPHLWLYRNHPFIKARKPPLTYAVLWIFFSLLLVSITNAVLFHNLDGWTLNLFLVVLDVVQYGCTLAYATRYTLSCGQK